MSSGVDHWSDEDALSLSELDDDVSDSRGDGYMGLLSLAGDCAVFPRL
jgi:hypothetical protein